MRFPSLDERLQAAADLFTACDIGADIGADHGRLSCYLLQHQICDQMIVADISADSLSKAQCLLKLHHLDDRAVFRVADGLDALDGLHAQSIAICGMGGRVMSSILLNGYNRLMNANLILSCHTEIPLVRSAICQIDYHIDQEKLVRAKNRYYVVMKALPGKEIYSDKELYLGPVLIRQKPDLWQAYLAWRYGVVACEHGHEVQLQWIREEITDGSFNGKNGS